MSTDTKVMEMDRVEYAIIINALMDLRNNLKQEEKETDLVDKVIRKAIKLPNRRKGILHKARE